MFANIRLQASIFYMLFMIFLLGACQPQSEIRMVRQDDVISDLRESSQEKACEKNDHYIPDTAHLEFYPMRFIRINFHYMNSEDGTQNYTGEEALKYTQNIIYQANKDLSNNHRMFLPHGHNNPALPLRFRYVLTPASGDPSDNGVYTHFDDDLYYMVTLGKNRNNYSRDVLRKYEIGSDSILNIFIMPHHPDSVASPTYSAVGSGIALGNCVKLTGLVENGTPAWGVRGLLNHEVGHVFGLRHTWRYNDGCEDTPRHPGCWNKSDNPPCDSMYSNNVMDYNAHQNAWTPCQIGIVRKNMGVHGSRKRKLIRPDWCSLQPDTLLIRDSIHWQGMKDLQHNIRIEPGGTLRIGCQVTMPPGSSIRVMNGGTLIIDNATLYNACGKSWRGIEIEDAGKDGRGIVVFVGNARLLDTENPLSTEEEPVEP